jgi:CheY-like chemotaxis protein
VEPVVANAMITDMTDLLSRTLGEHIRIVTVLAEDAWSVETDRSQLENALLNMSVNARDAMPDGGELRIETANVTLPRKLAQEFGIPTGRYLGISVTDTGMGMSEEVAARAFDPFFTTKGVGKGTGLGLSQVFGFVRQSGGHVTIATQSGRGTTIRLYLPKAEQTQADHPGQEDSDETMTGRPNEIVLVVEDEDRVRTMAVGALEGLGYEVIEAASASEALEIVSQGRPVTLLFTDIVMPEMSGGDLAVLARARAPNLKILFTTGYAPDDNRHMHIEGVDSRPLHKPYSLDQLSRRIRAAIDG